MTSGIERTGASIQRLARRMDEHPYRTLATAVGVGYVLGGGLFSSTTRRLVSAALKLAIRFAALPFYAEPFAVLMLGAADSHNRGETS